MARDAEFYVETSTTSFRAGVEVPYVGIVGGVQDDEELLTLLASMKRQARMYGEVRVMVTFESGDDV